MNEPNSIEEANPSKSRSIWLLIAGFAALLVGLVAWSQFRDSAPVDDSRWLPVYTQGGGENNPLIQFIQALNALPDSGWDQLPKEVQDGEGTPEEIRNFLDQPQNQARLRLWDSLVQSDATSWRFRFQDYSLNDPLFHIKTRSELLPFQRLIGLQIVSLGQQGHLRQAMDLVFEMNRVGQNLVMAEGGMADLTLALTLQRRAYRSLEKLLTNYSIEDNLLAEAMGKIPSSKPDLKPYKHALSSEYAHFKTLLGHYRTTGKKMAGVITRPLAAPES